MERLMKLVRLFRVANRSLKFSMRDFNFVADHLVKMYGETRVTEMDTTPLDEKAVLWARRNQSAGEKILRDLTDGYL